MERVTKRKVEVFSRRSSEKGEGLPVSGKLARKKTHENRAGPDPRPNFLRGRGVRGHIQLLVHSVNAKEG